MAEAAAVGTIDINRLREILPHRYPFLLVDRITAAVPGQKASGYKNVTANDPFFQGHFPQRPVMPGVLILEGMSQVAAVCALLEDADNQGQVILLAGFEKVRFRRMVVPGDRLDFEVQRVKRKGDFWIFQGLASVQGEMAAEAEIRAAVAKKA